MSTLITNKQQREIVHQEYIFISSQVCGNRLLIHGKTSQFPPLLNCHEPVELIGYTPGGELPYEKDGDARRLA